MKRVQWVVGFLLLVVLLLCLSGCRDKTAGEQDNMLTITVGHSIKHLEDGLKNQFPDINFAFKCY